jgi:hypothetical protein
MKQIKVDFNARGRAGFVRASLGATVGAPLEQGEDLLAIDLEEGIQASARVAEVDPDAGIALIEVDWDSFEDLDRWAEILPSPWVQPLIETDNRGSVLTFVSNTFYFGPRTSPLYGPRDSHTEAASI